MLRYLTAGESHGEALVAILEGLPAGLLISEDYINFHLERRQKGYGRGARMQIEKDTVRILSGVRKGLTTGSPLSFLIENKDWENWKDKETPVLSVPRPGHADFSGIIKYGLKDIRDVLERASARETAARTAIGAVCQKLLSDFNIKFYSHVRRIGPVEISTPIDEIINNYEKIEQSEVRTLEKEDECKKAIDSALKDKDSLGGIIEVIITGCPPGLGSYVHWDRKLDANIAKSIISVQSVKAIEFGDGFSLSSKRGSETHDEIFYNKEKGFFRKTNRAGGIEGGMTNGEPVIFRACIKPIPTLLKPLKSVDIFSKEAKESFKERSDICAVPSAAVICENVAAFEICREFLISFGSDSLEKIKFRFNNQKKLYTDEK